MSVCCKRYTPVGGLEWRKNFRVSLMNVFESGHLYLTVWMPFSLLTLGHILGLHLELNPLSAYTAV